MPSPNELVMSEAEIKSTLADDVAADAADTHDAGDLDGDVDIESSWEDKRPGEDDYEDVAAAKKAESPRRKGAADEREYKADGKLHKVDHADRKRVDELVTLGLGARRAFSERDTLKKAVTAKETEIADLKKYRDLWNQLEDLKHDHDGLYKKIFDKDFDAVAKDRGEWQARYDAASPAEKRAMETLRKIEQADRDTARRERDAKKREEELTARQHEAELKEAKTGLVAEFMKYEFSSKVSNPERAEALNSALWRLTIANLKQQIKPGQTNVTPEEARREFRRVAQLLAAKEEAKREVKQIVDDKKKTAKEQARAASTRNYTEQDLDKFAKEKDPVKLFRKMFGRSR